jgi:hypothetical protein
MEAVELSNKPRRSFWINEILYWPMINLSEPCGSPLGRRLVRHVLHDQEHQLPTD